MVTKVDITRQGQFSGDTSVQSNKLTNLTDPTSAQDAATKAYVDAAAVGIDWKASVRVATTVAGTLASSFENGDTVDGITLVTNDRILIKNQATGSENGIYKVSVSGAPTRTTDADTSAEVNSGMAVFVEEGTANADGGWVLTTNDPITLGTTPLAFTQFTGLGQVTAGAGLTKTGNTIDVMAGDASILVNPDELHVQIADASLDVSGGLRVVHGTGGQVYIANASGVLTPVSLSGDVSSVSNTGLVTLASTIYKAANFVTRETPTPAVDGATTAFTLANTPTAGTEEVFLNGILQEPGAGNDYTISGATITYLAAPLSTDRLRVNYRK